VGAPIASAYFSLHEIAAIGFSIVVVALGFSSGLSTGLPIWVSIKFTYILHVHQHLDICYFYLYLCCSSESSLDLVFVQRQGDSRISWKIMKKLALSNSQL
jgi:hypothetical protein